jgi:nucleotide-binding universal stress UspA family protein
VFQRILVPIDLADTETANKTLAVAAEIADAGGGHLLLVHVRYVLDMATSYIPANTLEADQKAAIGKLKTLAATLKLGEERVSVASPAGRVYSEVLAAAEDFKADLVVVGPHSPSMAKFLLGSDAGRIVRHAPMSVLVVR